MDEKGKWLTQKSYEQHHRTHINTHVISLTAHARRAMQYYYANIIRS